MLLAIFFAAWSSPDAKRDLIYDVKAKKRKRVKGILSDQVTWCSSLHLRYGLFVQRSHLALRSDSAALRRSHDTLVAT